MKRQRLRKRKKKKESETIIWPQALTRLEDAEKKKGGGGEERETEQTDRRKKQGDRLIHIKVFKKILPTHM